MLSIQESSKGSHIMSAAVIDQLHSSFISGNSLSWDEIPYNIYKSRSDTLFTDHGNVGFMYK